MTDIPVALTVLTRIAELERENLGFRKSLSAAKQIIALLTDELAAAQAREKARCETGNQYVIDNARLTEQLAASQAREKVLRDALDHHQIMTRPIERTQAALTQPADDTALKSLLKAERERVAKHFESRSYLGSGHQLAIEIRAMGDE